MLDIKFIRENVELIKNNIKNRQINLDIDKFIELDSERKNIITEIETLRAKRNESSKTKPNEEDIIKMKKIGDEISDLEKKLIPIESTINEQIQLIPNLTHPEVKISTNEEDNVVISENIKPKEFDFDPIDHVVLSEKLDLIDFERGTKVAGSKFYYLKNELVLLEMALIQYAFEITMKHGFSPIITPDLAYRDIVAKMGYNPRGESTQVYNIDNSDLSLIGTSEITIGGYHKDEVIEEADLPKKYVALSHCFRTEAGSYSKYSKGIFRVHQFTKVEMFIFVTPEKVETFHKEMLEIEKEIYSGLSIPYRVISHCSADLGAPSACTYDLEVWMPGKSNKDGKMGDWAEVTSTSNCTDYQARALNIKYKNKEGKKELLNTINGTAIAMPRTIIAILENFQKADHSIEIPEALHKYLPFKEINNSKIISLG